MKTHFPNVLFPRKELLTLIGHTQRKQRPEVATGRNHPHSI